MFDDAIHDEAQRTAALAFWRYAHDYLRIAQTLCKQHRIACIESQVPYHIAAQGLEFAMKASEPRMSPPSSCARRSGIH